MTNPFGENAHGFAAGGVKLRFAPGAGFGKAEVVENVDDEVDANGGADEDYVNGLTGGSGFVRRARWQCVGFGVGDKFGHGGMTEMWTDEIQGFSENPRSWIV